MKCSEQLLRAPEPPEPPENILLVPALLRHCEHQNIATAGGLQGLRASEFQGFRVLGPSPRTQSLRSACIKPIIACAEPITACAAHVQGLSQRAQGLHSVRRACAGPAHSAHITPARDLAESRENSDQKLRVLMGGF